MLSNHSEQVGDSDALHFILEAVESVADRLPGEVGIAIYTPADSVWLYTLHHGAYELQPKPDGSWSATEVEG